MWIPSKMLQRQENELLVYLFTFGFLNRRSPFKSGWGHHLSYTRLEHLRGPASCSRIPQKPVFSRAFPKDLGKNTGKFRAIILDFTRHFHNFYHQAGEQS